MATSIVATFVLDALVLATTMPRIISTAKLKTRQGGCTKGSGQRVKTLFGELGEDHHIVNSTEVPQRLPKEGSHARRQKSEVSGMVSVVERNLVDNCLGKGRRIINSVEV